MTPASPTGQQRVRAERSESGEPTAADHDRRMPSEPSMRHPDAEQGWRKEEPKQSRAGTGQSGSLVVRAARLRSRLDELEHGHGQGDWEAEWATDERRAAQESISKLQTLLSLKPPAKATQIVDWITRVVGSTEPNETEPWLEQVYKHARGPECRVDKDWLLKRAVTVERVVLMMQRERGGSSSEPEVLAQGEPMQSGGVRSQHHQVLRMRKNCEPAQKARRGQRDRDVQKLRVELDAAVRSSDARLVVSVLQRPNITQLISDAVGWAATEIDRESVSADEESQEWAARLDFWMAILDLLEGRLPQAFTPSKPTKPVPMVTGYRESKKRTMQQLVSSCLYLSAVSI